MHEVDMAIERNVITMRLLEPIADEMAQLRDQEEKAGQPIGRLQYNLKTRTLNSIHIGAIARVYGESGDEVIQHLLRNPLVVVPIVYRRMKEKDVEWRKAKEELTKEWKDALKQHFVGSLDVKSMFCKVDLEKRASDENVVSDRIAFYLLPDHSSEFPLNFWIMNNLQLARTLYCSTWRRHQAFEGRSRRSGCRSSRAGAEASEDIARSFLIARTTLCCRVLIYTHTKTVTN